MSLRQNNNIAPLSWVLRTTMFLSLIVEFKGKYCFSCGPGSVVGIATGYGLGGPGIESRWVARYSSPVQTGPGAHPASCTLGTVSFPGVKSGRGVTLTHHPLLVPWSRKSRAIPQFPLWAVRPVQCLSACTQGCTLTFTVFIPWIRIRRNATYLTATFTVWKVD